MLLAKSCAYNLDSGKLEMVDADGALYSVDVNEVEYEYADNMYERSALDYLLYNEPVEYMNLLLEGEWQNYIKAHPIYLEDL